MAEPRRWRGGARCLALVAEQTGYPPDMLDLDLDLEADLGIDTVKQAEVFATIREAYGIERDDTLKLRDYPTLNHVVGVRARRRAGHDADAPDEPQAPAPARPSASPQLPRGRHRGLPPPRPGARLRPPSTAVGHRRDAWRGQPRRARARPGGVGAALADRLQRARRRGARPSRRAGRRGARGTARRVAGRRADPRRLLAPRARRRGPARRLDRPAGASAPDRVKLLASPCVRSPARSARRARSWSPPPGWAAATATTRRRHLRARAAR